MPTEGTLWTWTVQRFAPKAPPYQPPADGFRPFAVGYVEIPDGTRILAVLDVAEPRIGMALVVEQDSVEEGSVEQSGVEQSGVEKGGGVPRAREVR